MSDPRLRVLIVEDVEDDAELISSHLTRSGFEADCERVDTANELTAALTRQAWDLILTDYTMPALTVTKVLEIIREQDVTVPCILVSGTASDETARAAMKLGMDDFVSKNNLVALGPVVTRALSDERTRGARCGVPRLRLTSGQEFQIIEWSSDRHVVDGDAALRPGNDRDGLVLNEGEATRVRVRVLGCEVQTVSSEGIVYRTEVAVLA